MRRCVPAIVAALVVVAPAAALTAAGHDPQKRLNPRDQATARALLLTQADLGSDWSSKPPPASRGDGLSCRGFDPDLSDLVETGEARSPVFARAITSTIFSSAAVYADARTAAAAWKRVMRPALVRCLTSLLVEGGSTSGLDIKTLSSGPLRFPHVAPRTAAFRIAVEVKALGVALQITIDLVALGSGRSEAVLFLISAQQPFSGTLERRLARIVSARLRA
jgi:hypothetical protein